MSSKFGCASEIMNNDVKDYCDKNEDSGSSKVDEAGNRALTETFFGTPYWCDEIPYNLTEEWREAASSQTSTKYESEMSLPPLNPFVPQKYDIKRDEGTTAMTVDGGEMKDEYEEREEKGMNLLNDRRNVPNQSKDPTLIFNDKVTSFSFTLCVCVCVFFFFKKQKTKHDHVGNIFWSSPLPSVTNFGIYWMKSSIDQLLN